MHWELTSVAECSNRSKSTVENVNIDKTAHRVRRRIYSNISTSAETHWLEQMVMKSATVTLAREGSLGADPSLSGTQTGTTERE